MQGVVEFVPLTDRGRRFREQYLIRLGDADEEGLLRLDGAARFLQDVATDDWTDTGVVSGDTWVVRRTSMRLAEGARWPRYLDLVALTTWCGGTGAAWAERRTNFEFKGSVSLEAVSLWVPINASGHPQRMRESFFEVYGEQARERKVSGRVTTPPIPEVTTSRPWPLRAADLDILGHVNNAAVWQAVSEVVRAPVRHVSVTHHASIERDDVVTLVTAPGGLWMCVDGVAKVSAQYEV
ncbi:MAG: acyl-ACP thioesterase domain-containing protein [Acidimicrobiales bacterium]